MTAPCPTLGFIVTIALRGDASAAESDQVVPSLLEFLRGYDLSGTVRGGGVAEVVVRRDGSQATDADRALVAVWSTQWANRATITVGDVVDLTGPL